MFWSQVKNVSIFHPLELVGHGGETQLQVGADLNYMYLTWSCEV